MSVALGRVGSGLPSQRADRRTLGGRVRRIALATFFASVAVNAALGICAVLAPDFGATQRKVLATSLCVTGALLIALACEPAWERKHLGPVPFVGAGLGAAGFAVAVVNVWTELADETLGKAMGSIIALAVGCAVASLLALARLAPGHRWLRTATYALLAVGTGAYATLPWLEDPGGWVLRPFGVVMIALAALVVTMPVVHWIDRGALAVAEATDAIRYCPYCGRGLVGEAGPLLTCERCGREFRVLEAPRPGASTST